MWISFFCDKILTNRLSARIIYLNLRVKIQFIMEQPNIIENISTCFHNLPQEEIDYLAAFKTPVNFAKGETIFKQGAFAPHVLFVIKGNVIIYRQIGKKRINIRMAKLGDYISLSSIFNNNTYQYSAISLCDSVVCMIDKEALRRVIMRNPDFAWQIISQNDLIEHRYLDIINNVSYKQMRGKLASAILYLSGEEFQNDDVFQYLTRQDLADFASITVESTVKFLKEFENDGILSLEGKNIVINNIQGLTEISIKG